MRLRIYILTVLALVLQCMLQGVHAQRINSVEWENDSVEVVYTLPLHRPGSDRQLTVYPRLCGAKDTVPLNIVLIRGKRYAAAAHRDFVLDGLKKQGYQEPEYLKAKDIDSVLTDTCRLALAEYPWVLRDHLTICVDNEEEGCCRVETASSGCSEEYAYSSPVIIPFLPVDTTAQEGEPGDSTGTTVEADTTETIMPIRYLPKTVAGFSVQKQVPEVIRRINSGALRSLEDYRPYTSTEILAKDTDALLVYFELDKILLKEEYRDNKVILDSIIRLVDELLTDTTVDVKLVQIVGLASAEGPLEHNKWLAGERAQALERYIRNVYPEMTDDMFETNNGGEAWTELRYQVEQSEPFEGREEILDIIDNTKDVNLREEKIKALRGGSPYKYILENILLDQRNSGYIRIYYDVTDDAARVINKAINAMQDGDNALALEMLQVAKKDPRAWNSLGVALWLSADDAEVPGKREAMRREAMTWFEKAAANGDQLAKKNVEKLKRS